MRNFIKYSTAIIYILAAISLASLAFRAFASESCVTSSQQEEVQETKLITTDVPSHLKGAKIIIKLADGRQSEVPAELFKVVPRKQERLITKVATNTLKTCQQSSEFKNRVSLLAGRGAKAGLSKSVRNDGVDVESRVGGIGGLQYQRLLNEKISVGAQAQTNKTGLLSIGLDF